MESCTLPHRVSKSKRATLIKTYTVAYSAFAVPLRIANYPREHFDWAEEKERTLMRVRTSTPMAQLPSQERKWMRLIHYFLDETLFASMQSRLRARNLVRMLLLGCVGLLIGGFVSLNTAFVSIPAIFLGGAGLSAIQLFELRWNRSQISDRRCSSDRFLVHVWCSRARACRVDIHAALLFAYVFALLAVDVLSTGGVGRGSSMLIGVPPSLTTMSGACNAVTLVQGWFQWW